MKKKYSAAVIGILSLLLFLAACQSSIDLESNQTTTASKDDLAEFLTEESLNQEMSDSVDGITVAAEKENYSASDDVIIVTIQNDSPSEFITGTQVFLEKEMDGKWYKVPMKSEFFTEEAIGHPPGESAVGLDFADLKHPLTPGQYRAVIKSLAAPFKVVE